MIEPHGGSLVDGFIDRDRVDDARASLDGPRIPLDTGSYQDAINLASGRYSPLRGFITQNDYRKVVTDLTLEDGTVWPLPIALDVDNETAAKLAPGTRAGLEDPDGELIGYLDVDEVFTYNKEHAARRLFDTEDRSHPGVASLFSRGNFLCGGEVSLFEEIRYNVRDLFPAETRVLFNQNGWTTVAGFQTRNAPHRAHEYIQKSALELVDGLLIHPKFGDKKENDYRDEVIIEAYRTLIENYFPRTNVALSVFPSMMRYAGPREAVFDAIVRKNQGCTHFIIGRDHAGVSDYYHEKAAQRIFDLLPEIGIDLLFFDHSFYCHNCDGMASERTCPHEPTHRDLPSGSKIRTMIQRGERPSDKLLRPEVAESIMATESPFVTTELAGAK